MIEFTSKSLMPVNKKPIKHKEIVIELTRFSPLGIVCVHLTPYKQGFIVPILSVGAIYLFYNKILKIKVFENWKEKSRFSFCELFYLSINQPELITLSSGDLSYPVKVLTFLNANNPKFIRFLDLVLQLELTPGNMLPSMRRLIDFLTSGPRYSLKEDFLISDSIFMANFFSNNLRLLTHHVEAVLSEYSYFINRSSLSDEARIRKLDIFLTTEMRSWFPLSLKLNPNLSKFITIYPST